MTVRVKLAVSVPKKILSNCPIQLKKCYLEPQTLYCFGFDLLIFHLIKGITIID